MNDVNTVGTGVSYTCSMIKVADITDGTSDTYLAGEKYLDPDAYMTGQDDADNEAALVGHDDDIARWSATSGGAAAALNPATQFPPYPDTPGVGSLRCFGSAHLSGFNMAFCDGSVHTMNYSMDFETHRRLSNRKDGLPIDGKKY